MPAKTRISALLAGMLWSLAVGHNTLLTRVPKAKHLFGLSASPIGKDLFLYRTEDKPEGEITFGAATLVRLGVSPKPRVIGLKVPTSLDDFTIPVWSRDGRTVYFKTGEGLYSLEINAAEPRLLWRGSAGGLALSPDGSQLAFWNLAPKGESPYELVVFDLKRKREIRTWDVESRFGSDRYGFEIAFASGGHSVFARTYDEESHTPLKQFIIHTGESRTVLENCLGLAAAHRYVYCVGRKNEKQALLRIAEGTGAPVEVVSDFRYGKLSTSGTRRWVVAQDLRRRRFAIYDSEENKLIEFGNHCGMATVLSTGEVVYAYKGALLSAPTRCKTQ